MKRATQAEAAEMHRRLSEWQSQAAMTSLLKELARPHGFYAAGQGSLQKWREAHCACQFARTTEYNEVRLRAAEPPDFELRSNNRVIGCELVEVRDPNSRTGAEFDLAANDENARIIPSPAPFDTEAHLKWLPAQLEACVKKKAEKGYDSKVVLAVFIHAWIFEGQQKETDRTICNAVIGHLGAFAEVWVLASGRLLTFSVKRADRGGTT